MRAFLILIGCVALPVILGIAGFRVGSIVESGEAAALVSVVGFLIGCIPAVVLWMSTRKSGYPDHDVGDAGFWISGGASGGSAQSPDSVDVGADMGGGDGGGGADGGGGGD